jgi:drug/metabolite transporter (DMT)-like permease
MTSWLTALAMLAFAGNSLLCRLALKHTTIDPLSFTSLRLMAGALTLWLIVLWRMRTRASGTPLVLGSWPSALALFVYAAGFSLAYVSLSAATGALLLFGVVQTTMIGVGLARGERLRPVQWLGFSIAVAGLVWLLLPGFQAPPLLAAALMALAGVAWAIYTLRAKGTGDPTQATAGNFIRTVPITIFVSAVSILAFGRFSVDTLGLIYALLSGAITSGIGYAIWYAALPKLKATFAATVQLSVPVLAAIGGILLLAEPASPRLLVACIAVIGGIALVLRKAPAATPPRA